MDNIPLEGSSVDPEDYSTTECYEHLDGTITEERKGSETSAVPTGIDLDLELPPLEDVVDARGDRGTRTYEGNDTRELLDSDSLLFSKSSDDENDNIREMMKSTTTETDDDDDSVTGELDITPEVEIKLETCDISNIQISPRQCSDFQEIREKFEKSKSVTSSDEDVPVITSAILRAASPNSVNKLWNDYISGCEDASDGMAMSTEHYIDPLIFTPPELTPADVTIKFPPTPMNTFSTRDYISDYSHQMAEFLTDKDDNNSEIRLQQIV